MIQPERLFRELAERGIDFFAGVPDSLLSDFAPMSPTMSTNLTMSSLLMRAMPLH